MSAQRTASDFVERKGDRRAPRWKPQRVIKYILMAGLLVSLLLIRANQNAYGEDRYMVVPVYPNTSLRDYGSQEDAYVVISDDTGDITIAPTLPFSSVPDPNRRDEQKAVQKVE